MHILRSLLLLIVSYFLSGMISTGALEPANDISQHIKPKIVVSIPPFYGLILEIMQGVEKPELLLPAAGSSHHAVLSPKHMEALEKADIVFWGGPDLETFLIQPLKNLDPQTTQIVQLDTTPGIRWLQTRVSANFSDEADSHREHGYEHEHGHGHGHQHKGHKREHEHQHEHGQEHEHAHSHGLKDMHFWLNPQNALALVDHIQNTLSKAYPKNRGQFEKNAKRLKQDIQSLDKKLKSQLASIRNKPYLVLHDGYQYFEQHYGLKAVGAITHHPELPLSVARMQTIRMLISREKVLCIFSEPGTSAKLAESLAKEFNLRMGILDPMERPDNKGDYRYVSLLEGLANSLLTCLSER